MRVTSYRYLPAHIKDRLLADPMYLQRRHDEEVARYRFLTKADVWVPKSGGNWTRVEGDEE